MDVSPVNGGTIEVDQTPATSYPYVIELNNGQEVSLNAVPNHGYEFTGWNGSLTGNDNPATIIIDCNKRITARFSQRTYTLTININGNGYTTPAAGNHNHPIDTNAIISATPEEGWQFDGWTGDVMEPESSITILTVDASKTVTANFSEIKPNWWLIDGSIVGFLVVIVAIWLAFRNRST